MGELEIHVGEPQIIGHACGTRLRNLERAPGQHLSKELRKSAGCDGSLQPNHDEKWDVSDQRQQLKPKGWIWRIVVSATVLSMLFWTLPAHQIWRNMQQVPNALWALALVIFLSGQWACSVKWWILIEARADVPYRSA